MVRLKEAENSETIKSLKNKIDDLEQVHCRNFISCNSITVKILINAHALIIAHPQFGPEK